MEEQLTEIVDKADLIQSWINLKKPQVNHPKAPKLPKFIPNKDWMTKTFHSLQDLSENMSLSSRIQSVLEVTKTSKMNFF